jgi:hypothetical protein
VQISRCPAWAKEAAGICATGVPTGPAVELALGAQAARIIEASKTTLNIRAIFIFFSFGFFRLAFFSPSRLELG